MNKHKTIELVSEESYNAFERLLAEYNGMIINNGPSLLKQTKKSKIKEKKACV